MKQQTKRLLCIVLIAAIVFSLIPATMITTAHAEDSGAFGISTPTEMTEEEKKASENNPFGEMGTGAFPLLVKSELYITYGWDGNDASKGVNYVKSYDTTDNSGLPNININGVTDQVGYNDNVGENGNAYMAAAVDGFNPGSGKDEYVVLLGLNARNKRLELSITDKSGQRVSKTSDGNRYIVGNRSGDNLNWLVGQKLHRLNGFLNVASGDFDGDGMDSIIMYEVGAGKSQIPSLREYTVAKSGPQLVISDGGLVMDSDGMYSVLGGDVSNMTDTDAKNAPKVQMEAVDTDKDGYDELVVTISMNDTHNGNNMKHLGTQVFIYDKLSSGWTLTARFSMKNDGVATDNSYADDRYRMVWGTSTVGNVIASDDSGGSTDFPEIVTVGMQDNESTDMHNINVDGNDKLVYSVIHCTGMTESDTGMKNYQGKYEAVGHGNLAANAFTKAGFYEDEDVSPLLQTKSFSYKGAAEAEAVFISGSVYTWKDNAGNGELNLLYTAPFYNSGSKKADGHDLDNMQVESVAAGNFDGNEDGREQIVSAYLLKRDDDNNNGFSGLVTIGCYGDSETDEESEWQASTAPGGNYISRIGKAYVALTDFDYDADSVIVKYQNVEKQWSDPKVMAILAASPYFHDIGLDNNSCTDYGIDRSTETSSETSHSLTTNFVVGYEYSTLAGNGGGVEATIENNLTWSSNNSRTVTYSTNYSNNTDTHQVVVYRSPTLVYRFANINNGEKVYLAKALSPATTMISVEEYNEQAASYNLKEIDESELKLGTPGDPSSYPSAAKQITTAVDKEVTLGDDSWSYYSSGGTITKAVSVGEMSGSSFNYEFDFSLTAYGLIFGAKVGGGAGYGYETTTSVVNGTEISRSGTVEGVGGTDYDFQWNFATWSIDLKGLTIPVCGYLVQNVTAPPSPAENLNITDITSDSLTLQWDAGIRRAEKYNIYRVLEASTDPYLYIGSVSGDAAEFSYPLSGLDSGTSYTFVVRGASGNKESVDSASATACTSLPGGNNITINPLQSTYSVAPGDSVTLRTSIATSSSIASLTIIWQTRASGTGNWRDIDGATGESLTLSDVTKDMDGSQYRLRVKAVTTSANVGYYYSNTATLSVSTTDTAATLSITGAGGGSGTLNPYDPYTGNATTVIRTPITETENRNVPATFRLNSTEGLVYQVVTRTEDSDSGEEGSRVVSTPLNPPVYIGRISQEGTDGENTISYYALSKGTDDTYSVKGDALTVTEKYVDENDTAITLSTTDSEDVTKTVRTGESAVTYNAVALWNDTATGADKYKQVWQQEQDGNYYTYADDTFTPISLDEGYEVLGKITHSSASGVMVSGASLYWITDVTTDPTKTEVFTREYITVSEGESATEYAISNLEQVTITQSVEVITGYRDDTKTGTELTLSATLKKANGGKVLSDIGADFVITNQDTGTSEIIHKTSGSDGRISTKWTASSAGLYAIQVSIPGTTTLSSSLTETRYYYASSQSDETQYRLRLQVSGSDVAGSVSYGDTVSLVPQSKTGTEDWEALEIDADSGLSLTAAQQGGTVSTLTGTSYAPDKAGEYTFSLVKTEDTTKTALATATLTVNPFKLTVTPVWEGTIPSSLDAVTLKFTDASGNKITSLPNSDETKLEGVLVKTSTYDFTDPDPEPGVYYVNMSWNTADDKQSDITALNNAYSITLSSASFYKIDDAAPVRYEVVGGNGSIDATGEQYIHFASGEQQSQGTPLRFQATPDTGYLVKNWKVNGQVISADSTDYEVTPISGGNSQMLTISSFDTARDVSNGELLVQVEFTNQTSTVNYSAVGDGRLTAKTSQGTAVQSGTSVVYGASVVFTAVPEEGQMVKEWKVTVNNGTAKTYTWPESGETYRENTLTLSDLAEDSYTVSVEFTQKQTFTVAAPVFVDDTGNTVNVGTITMTDANGEEVSAGDELEQGKAITYTVEFTDSNFNTVNAWEYSTDGNHWSSDPNGGQLTYSCCKGSTGTLYVRAVVSVSQSYTLNWKVMEGDEEITDTSIASLTATSGNTTLTSGNSYPINTPVDFTLELDENYYVVDWNNATPAEDGKSATLTLNGNTAVTVTVAEKPTVTWEDPTGGTISVVGTVKGSETKISSGDHVDQNTTITITATPNDNYVVDTINGADVNTDKSNGSKTKTVDVTTDDINVSVSFLAKPVVTFGYSSNGSVKATLNGSDTEITSGTYVDFGSNLTFTATPEDGYRVKGWYSDVYGTTPIPGTTSEQNSYTIENLRKDASVYVEFELITYTITFDTDGGTTIEPITQPDGTAVIAPEDPTKTGYTFVGWDKDIPETMPAEDMTITAQWKINQYTITFETNGGTPIDPITQDYGTAVTAPENPTKTGYAFGGWYEDETLSDTPFVFTEDATITDRDITLYAKWNPMDGTKYTVIHKYENLDGETYTTETEEMTGVTDDDTEAQAKNVTGFTAGSVTQQKIKGDGTTEIEIIYTRNTYTLTFKPENGEADIVTTVKYGAPITAPADPERSGYTFVGWDKEIPDTMPAEDVTITAEWVVTRYTITVGITGSGSVTADCDDAAMGNTVTLTVVPDEDYKLETLTVTDENGDDISVEDLGDDEYSFTMPASKVSIRAVFAHTNHSYESVVTEPTCTEQGYTTHTCSICGDSYVDTYVDANGHSFGEWTETKAATCTEKGEESRSCAVCNATETREIAALGHNYQNGTCTNCGKSIWKDWLDKIFGDRWGDEEEECDHVYTSVVTEPTCEEQGYTTHTCELCGDSYKDSYTDALGHEWDEGKVTKEATCTEDGETTFTCKTCGKTKTEKIDALGHKFENGVCTECGEEEASEPENPGNSGWDNFWDWILNWWN